MTALGLYSRPYRDSSPRAHSERKYSIPRMAIFREAKSRLVYQSVSQGNEASKHVAHPEIP